MCAAADKDAVPKSLDNHLWDFKVQEVKIGDVQRVQGERYVVESVEFVKGSK